MSDFEENVRDIAQDVHDQNSTTDQFAVSQVPYHTHNGTDSPRVHAQDLNGTQFVTNPVPLIDAPMINTDASRAGYFFVTLGGNRVLTNPRGAIDGQRIIYEIIQDSTGSRTLAFGSQFAFGTAIPSITLTTTAAARDFIGIIYRQTTQKFYIVAFANGY